MGKDGGGALQGCVWLEPLDGDLWYLGSVAIDPQQQAAGLGKVLLSAAEPWVTARGGNRFGTPLRDDLSFVVLEKGLTGFGP